MTAQLAFVVFLAVVGFVAVFGLYKLLGRRIGHELPAEDPTLVDRLRP